MKITSTHRSGSMGLKLLLVCALVVLMAVPAMFVSFVSFERSSRADDVTREVSQRYGGQQYLTGPILVAPYHKVLSNGQIYETGEYVIFADEGSARFDDVGTEIRKRSLFKVPVFQARGEFSATFDPVDKARHESDRVVQWDEARFLIGISDGRGLSSDVFLKTETGQSLKFEPASHVSGYGSKSKRIYAHADVSETAVEVIEAEFAVTEYAQKVQRLNGLVGRNAMTFLSVPANDLISTEARFSVHASIDIGGASDLGVYPFAKSTQVSMSSDWGTPGFQGGFPPKDRTIDSGGFRANWSVPYLARGVLGADEAQNIHLFDPGNKSMAVQFVSEVSPYQTVNRALKYAVLFIGLVFMTFFLFEILVGVKVHPAQYVLIGLAQTIFYLLLLALSEHVGFVTGFLLASGATIGLTAAYAGAVLGGKIYAVRAGIVFAMTYGLLFTLMRLQDFALLIGALASFGVIALIMYLTRDLDWYGENKAEAQVSFKTSPAK